MQEFTVQTENYQGTYLLDGKAFSTIKIYPDIIKSKEAFLREKAELVKKRRKVLMVPDSHRKIEGKKNKYIRIMGYKVRIDEQNSS